MMNDALQSGDNGAEDFGELTAGDENVVDLEKDLETVAFACKLYLIGLGTLEIERVVHGDGHQAGDALHKLNFGIRDALWNDAAEAHRTQAVLRSGERKNREGTDVMLAEALQEFGEARFFLDVADDEGLLRLPDPAGRIVFNGSFRSSGFFAGDAGFETWRRMTLRTGSWRTRVRKSKSTTQCRRSARSWNNAGRSRCWAMASLTSSKAQADAGSVPAGR